MFNLANILTSCNLICGLISITFCFSGQLDIAVYCIFLGALFDFLDGFVARMLKLESKMGKELDSLSDLITFGVAPGFLMFFMILIGVEQPYLLENFSLKAANTHYENYYVFNQFIHWVQAFFYDFPNNFNASIKYLPFVAFSIPFLSLFRLSHFNVDTKQNKNFIGVPTPLNAIILCFFPLYFHENMMNWNTQLDSVHILFDCYSLAIICVLLSLTLIAPFPLMSMKLEGGNKIENKLKIALIIISVITIIVFKVLAIPIIITLYFTLSTYHYFKTSKNEI
ncbi:CDP-alcohol phosphatidyltransferase family protein [Crocinitomicaceae bacterium]|nr:CDP-alcohol phosphatidyltransferase family protein [Crocinitomicaceae bacterium]